MCVSRTIILHAAKAHQSLLPITNSNTLQQRHIPLCVTTDKPSSVSTLLCKYCFLQQTLLALGH
jgi:hypothetical protein